MMFEITITERFYGNTKHSINAEYIEGLKSGVIEKHTKQSIVLGVEIHDTYLSLRGRGITHIPDMYTLDELKNNPDIQDDVSVVVNIVSKLNIHFDDELEVDLDNVYDTILYEYNLEDLESIFEYEEDFECEHKVVGNSVVIELKKVYKQKFDFYELFDNDGFKDYFIDFVKYEFDIDLEYLMKILAMGNFDTGVYASIDDSALTLHIISEDVYNKEENEDWVELSI